MMQDNGRPAGIDAPVPSLSSSSNATTDIQPSNLTIKKRRSPVPAKLSRSRSLPSREFAAQRELGTIDEGLDKRKPATSEHEKDAANENTVVDAHSPTGRNRSFRLSLPIRKPTQAMVMEENYDLMMERFQLRKVSRSNRSSDRVVPVDSDHDGSSDDSLEQRSHAASRTGSRISRRSTSHLMGPKSARPQVSFMIKVWTCISTPLSPDCAIYQTSQLLLRVVLAIQLVFVPYQLAFLPAFGRTSVSINVIFEIVLLVDFVLQFNTGFYEKKLGLVIDRRQIVWRYAKTWMVLDLISSMPMDTIAYVRHNPTDSPSDTECSGIVHFLFILLTRAPRLVHVFRVRRMVWVVRLFRTGREVWKWLSFSRYSHLFRIVHMIAMVLLVTHYIACFWEMLHQSPTLAVESDRWAAGVVQTRYVQSFYDAIQLIQGQAVEARTPPQQIYASVATLIGSLLLAIVYGNVAMLVSNFNSNATNYQRKMESVFATMKKMQLPRDLQERIHEYYDHLWEEYESLDGDIVKFSHELSHTLALEVGLYKYMNVVMKLQFWEHCSADFVAQIVLHLVVRVYLPDDYIVRQGEVGDQMFMINRGVCELTAASSDPDWTKLPASLSPRSSISPRLRRTASNRSLDKYTEANTTSETATVKPWPAKYKLQSGQAFGELELIMNYKRTKNVRAISHVEMCVLSRRDFQLLLTRYRQDRTLVLSSILKYALHEMPIHQLPSPLSERVSDLTKQHGDTTARIIDHLVAEMTASYDKDESIVFGIQQRRNQSGQCICHCHTKTQNDPPVQTHERPQEPIDPQKQVAMSEDKVALADLAKKVGRLEKVERANHKILETMRQSSTEVRVSIDSIMRLLRSDTNPPMRANSLRNLRRTLRLPSPLRRSSSQQLETTV